ncbi:MULTISPECIES: zinc finger domain-containing protein [Methanosarcina]|uniref:zinc finger domain-containing protein n=1 Tax=Methanosarcina TaxID=2207 RepID=UPI0009E5C198|nr:MULTISPECIES: zinc finger domain-containing protein [Methanosarcina]
MFESSAKCVRCGTPLRKQVIGSNVFYYCKKCGCTSSAISASTSSQSAIQPTSHF